MHLSELDTPALLIDLDRMEENLQRVADYAAVHRFRLRPHTKTHKNPAIGRMQLALGAVGLAVAKVGEAEVMLETEVRDLLVAYPIVGASKLKRLMEVAKHTNVTVALDDIDVARPLSEAAQNVGVTVGVLAEVNIGMDRCGVAPGEELVALSRKLDRLPSLRFDGVEFYYGHVWLPLPDGEAQLQKVNQRVQQIRHDFNRAGLELKIISGGSTPALYHSHKIEGMNEIRPGTYVFNDVMQVWAGTVDWDQCAATIMATVVSTARDGFVIIDGGSKTFTSDTRPFMEDITFGRVTEAPESRFYKMNEEHGYIEWRGAAATPRIGDRVRVIPNHVCAATNMHERVYGIRGEQVEQVWEVKGRGKLQ